jgi:hypothetical protein
VIAVFQSMLVIVGIALAVASVVNGRSIKMHMQQNHPNVWKRLGFPAMKSMWVKAADESRHALAELEFFRFVRKGSYRELGLKGSGSYRCAAHHTKFNVL